MTDFNILNRASFDDQQIRFEIQMPPHLYEINRTLELGAGTSYWVNGITWKATYYPSGLNPVKVPIKPPTITVTSIDGTSILKEVSEPYPRFKQPKPIADKINFIVKNNTLANNMMLKMEFYLEGTLVKPKPGTSISYKEILAYLLMDESTKGKLAMEEAMIDHLDDKLISMGQESIRSKLPQGLGSLSMLPDNLKTLFLGDSRMMQMLGVPMPALQESTKAQKLLEISNADPVKEKSAFIGDMLSSLPDGVNLGKEIIQTIADHMIGSGWRKF